MGETPHSQDHIVRFINGACNKGVISAQVARALLAHRLHQLEPVPATTTAHPAFMPRSEPAPAPVAPAPVPQPVAPKPPPIRRPRRSEVWARYARQRSKKMWGTLSADFAANALTYLGVLLSIAVIFAFFAFGYFAEAIGPGHKQYRPLVEAGVVVFFLGLAWVLRHRTGIPQTSAAIELIGMILLPIMMSASFRDGCTPSYRPWCLPPDVDGPGRWAAYGVVALITTVVYALVARRRRIYAYLVGPMLWVAAGAFGLYLDDGVRIVQDSRSLSLGEFTRDGVSAPQLIAVLVAIAVTLAAATRIRRTNLGSVLAIPIVRSGVATAPLVGVIAVVFAFNDAVVRGIPTPSLNELAWPTVITTLLVAAVFALGARCGFAWEGLGDRLRREVGSLLGAASYALLAVAWVLTSGLGVTVGWIGVGLMGHAGLVAIGERNSTANSTTRMVQLTLAVGSALALASPLPATVAWVALSAAAIARLSSESVAAATSLYVPIPEGQRRLQVWTPVLVAAGAGVSRIGGLDLAAPSLLASAATLLLARRASDADVRSLAGVPTVTLVAGSVAAEAWMQIGQWAPTRFSIVLALGAALISVSATPRMVRLVGSGLLGIGAGAVASRGIWGTALETTTWADTTVLGVTGLAVVLAVRTWGSASLFGHILVVAAAVRSLPLERTAILGLTFVCAAHAYETVRNELDSKGIFENTQWLPPLLALSTLAPIVVLASNEIQWFTAAPERLGLVAAAISWIYAATAARRSMMIRVSAIPLAYIASLSAVALSVGSIWVAFVTTTSAAILMGLGAVAANRPLFTAPAWLLAITSLLLFAIGLGLSDKHVELVLHVAAFAIAVGAARWAGSRWSAVPAVIGALLLPIAIVSGTSGWIGWQGLAAVLAYVYLGRAFRIAWLSVPASLAAAAVYFGLLADTGWGSVQADAILWMPLAAGLVGFSGVLPGRRSFDLLTAWAPGVALVGFGLAAYALDIAAPTDAALVCLALIQAEMYVIRRSVGWLVGASTTLVIAGLVAGGFWAPLALALLTLVLGLLADRLRGDERAVVLRTAAATSFAATGVLFGIWMQWGSAETVAASVSVFTLFVLLAAGAELADELPPRLRDWRAAAFALSQAAALAAAGVSEASLSEPEAAGVLGGVVALEALLAGVIGTVRRSHPITLSAALLAAVTYAETVEWLAWTESEFVVVTGVTALALSVMATMATRARAESERVGVWALPLHGLVAVAVGSTVAAALSPVSYGHWISATILAGLGVHLAANAWAAPVEWPVRPAAVGSWLGSATLAMVASGQDGRLVLATGLALATCGLLVAIASGSLAADNWRLELLALWVGIDAIAAIGLLQDYSLLDAEFGVVLVLVGAASAAYGILARRLELLELALVTWLGSMLILVNEQFGIGLHIAVLISSVSLLGVLELERVRRELAGASTDRSLDDLEWVLLMAPLGLAALEMMGALWFGFVLLGEGAVLGTWGAVTQIRRRAVTGVAAMALSIVLFVAIPTVHGIMAGLSAGTWMAVGGVAAIAFIVAGSTIERQRHAIGRRLAHIGEILDEWD